MPEKEWFHDWFDTPYYHQLYFQRDLQEATAFIEKLLELLQPPAGSTMLDVACGKGRHSRILAGKGYDVTGIDLAAGSIADARQMENDHLHFYVHDIRQPFRIGYYEFAFNFFTSFGYFRTAREHYAALRTIANSLKMHGMFVIDYINVHYTEDHFQHLYDIQVNGTNFHITKWMDEQHFFKKIEVENEALPEPHVYTERVSKFSLGDFTEMLSFNGMQVENVYGDYNLGPYHLRNTPRMIIIAKKIRH